MGKVIEHQKELEFTLKQMLSDYTSITFVSSLKAKYLAIKHKNKVIITMYFRVSEIRIYVDDNEKNMDFYKELLNEKKAYQHIGAEADKSKGEFAFYVNENNEIEVIKRYIDEVYMCNITNVDEKIDDLFSEI